MGGLKLMLSFMDRWVWVRGWETRGFAFNNDKDLCKMSAGGIMFVHCSQYKPCLTGTQLFHLRLLFESQSASLVAHSVNTA